MFESLHSVSGHKVLPDTDAIIVQSRTEPQSRPHTDEYCRSDSKKSSTVEAATLDDRRAGDSEGSPGATVSSLAPVKFEPRAVVQFTAREEVMAKLERVRSLASHRLRGNASLEQVIELLADDFIKRNDPAARHERREQRTRKGTVYDRRKRAFDSAKGERRSLRARQPAMHLCKRGWETLFLDARAPGRSHQAGGARRSVCNRKPAVAMRLSQSPGSGETHGDEVGRFELTSGPGTPY
jgi:hypothetical protein